MPLASTQTDHDISTLSAQDDADRGRDTPVPTKVFLIANPNSGQNSRAEEPLQAALDVFGPQARIYRWEPGREISETVERAVRDGADLIVAAGGDGTVMAVAQAMLGRDVPMGVLPLGTFNFFARGLRLSEDPTEAAQQILNGQSHAIRVGTVEGRVFLNNASLGIYPSILKARESIYRRWGRHRIVAYWSVVRTFLKFQKPMHIELHTDGETITQDTPLVFVARSAYQLDFFGLEGAQAIGDDAFAVLVAKAEGRSGLFKLAWRLVTRTMREGRDYDLIRAKDLTIHTRSKRSLLAFDGEKSRLPSPFSFRMHPDLLNIILPKSVTDTSSDTQAGPTQAGAA
ncbi:hypothetical protein ERN12_08750 [Rhodobacteraceae bacterium]|nr:hypothetical protein ERN12_08750 [Paracoccaceae bacterium]